MNSSVSMIPVQAPVPVGKSVENPSPNESAGTSSASNPVRPGGYGTTTEASSSRVERGSTPVTGLGMSDDIAGTGPGDGGEHLAPITSPSSSSSAKSSAGGSENKDRDATALSSLDAAMASSAAFKKPAPWRGHRPERRGGGKHRFA